MANSSVQVGQVVYGVDHHWWLCTEIHTDGPYGYRVSGPDSHTPYRGGAGSGHPYHVKHHHGLHHHLRATASPHHADNSTPGLTRQTPSTPGRSAQNAPWSGPTTRPGNAPKQAFEAHPEKGDREGFNLGESVEAWEKRHARPIMAVQGLIDISAGAAGVITTIELISVLAAPETLGLSLALGIAVLAVYDITRGTGQMGAGVAELTTTAFGSKEDVERVGDGMERFKTLTSVSAYVSVGLNKAHHQRIDWKRAKHWSDYETFIGGISQGKLLGVAGTIEEVEDVLKLGPKAKAAHEWGERIDKADQVNSGAHDALDQYNNICQHLANQKQRRVAGCLINPQPAPGSR